MPSRTLHVFLRHIRSDHQEGNGRFSFLVVIGRRSCLDFELISGAERQIRELHDHSKRCASWKSKIVEL